MQIHKTLGQPVTNSCADHTSHQDEAAMDPAHRCTPSTGQTLEKVASSRATLRPRLTWGSRTPCRLSWHRKKAEDPGSHGKASS